MDCLRSDMLWPRLTGTSGSCLGSGERAAYAVYILTTLLALRLTRLRESYADAYSAFLTQQPRELESALTKIAYGLSLAPGEPHGARAFFIEDPAQAKQDVAGIMDQKSKYDLDKDGVLSERELEAAMEATKGSLQTREWPPRGLVPRVITAPPTGVGRPRLDRSALRVQAVEYEG